MNALLVDQIIQATKANLLVRYRQSITGFIWVILSPVLTLTAQSYAFHEILNLNIPNFHLFLFSGLLPWLFMIQTLEMSSSIIVNNGRVTKAYVISPIIFVGAQILDNFINFMIAYAIVLVWVLQKQNIEFSRVLISLLSMLPMLVAVSGLSVFFASLNVFYRDVKFVLSFILSIAFFITPVFYPESFVPERWRWLVSLNFLYKLYLPIRDSFFEPIFGDKWLTSYFIAWLVSLLCLALGFIYWKKKRHEIHRNI